jgi:photosystem II stability/assembly factor-like uncharacterized protein
MNPLSHFKIRIACTLFACAFVMLFGICVSPRAGARADLGAQVREASPKDGILCCNGLVPFLFNRDQVLTTTGRAGIFRFDNRGERWQRSMERFIASNGVSPYVDHVCQSRSQPRKVYALAGLGSDLSPFNGVFFSDDFGETWTRRGSVNTGFGLNACTVDASNHRTVYVSGFDDTDFTSKTWKSTDGGQTFEVLTNLPNCAAGGIVRSVPGAIYIFLGPLCMYSSTDGGNTFSQLAPPPTAIFGNGSGVSPDGRAIFVGTSDANFQPTGTFRSIDQGASWVAVNGLPNGFVSLAFDSTNSSRVYASDGLLRVSNDGGLTFTLAPASNDPRLIGPDPIRQIGVDDHGSVYLDNPAGPFRTDDGGQTLRSARDGFRASAVNDLAFDANGKLLVGVLHTQVVFRQTEGLNFEAIGNAPAININGVTNDNATALAASPTDPNLVLVAMQSAQGLYRTTNGGQSWTSSVLAQSPTIFNNARMAFPTSSRVYLVSPVSPQFDKPGLYRSNNAGRTFARLSTLQFAAIAVHPTNADTLYVGTYSSGEGLFKSTNGGHRLQDLGQPGFYSAIAVDRRNPNIVYAGYVSGQVIRSLDGGRTFSSASSGLTGAGVHGIAQDSQGTLYVWLRGGGLFSSRDAGSSWQLVDSEEALQRSGVEAGRGSLVVDPQHPGRVYLGNAGVIQVDAE